MGERDYTLDEISRDLEISVRSLREYIRLGVLPAQKVGRRYYVSPESLHAFLDADVVLSHFGIGKG